MTLFPYTTLFRSNDDDKIEFLNKEIKIDQKIYIVLNKPGGFICSNSNHDGISILNLIDENYIKGIHIVGRLDKDTTGIVLITNDGDFTHQIKNPKYKIEKEYEVTLEKEFTQDMYKIIFEQEIKLDGKKLKPFVITNINKNTLNITLIEGKYHQIKRIFSIVKNPVIKLKRIRIGNMNLNKLNIKEGEYIKINKEEFIKKISL